MLAPWNGGLYRANVLGVKDNILTVLYVDHGNTDTVSWWDCFSRTSCSPPWPPW